MNRKRNIKKKSISSAEVIFVVIAAFVIIAGCVNYAIIRNQQVDLDRRTDSVYQSVKTFEADMRSVRVEIDRNVNRFAIKSYLREGGSEMRERPDYVVERVYSIDRPLAGAYGQPYEIPQVLQSHVMASRGN